MRSSLTLGCLLLAAQGCTSQIAPLSPLAVTGATSSSSTTGGGLTSTGGGSATGTTSTSGGGTSSGGTSTATSTSGASQTTTSGGYQDLQACNPGNCPPTFQCVSQLRDQQCESPCITDDDCPDLGTSCGWASSTLNLCMPQVCYNNLIINVINGSRVVGPNPAGQSSLDSICTFGPYGVNTGTCLSRVINGSYWGLCILGGSAQLGRACDPEGTRSDLSLVCAPGLMCALDPTEPSPVCDEVCNPLFNSQCAQDGGRPYCRPSDRNQWPVELQPGLLGYCSASSDLDSADGGLCDPLEFLPCGSSSDCACGFVCASDPALGYVCERSCTKSLDCVDATTTCDSDGGACNLNVCTNLWGECAVLGQDTGTCVPVLSDAGLPYGVCVESGTADGGCDLRPTWQNAAGRCPNGSVCGPAEFGGTECQAFCFTGDVGLIFGSFDPFANMCLTN